MSNEENSNLTKNDVNNLVEAIKGHTQTSSEKLSDNFMKLAVGLCTVGIVWIMTSINEMKNEQVRSEEWRIMNTRQLDKMEQFMGEPRFTANSFSAAIQPYSYDIKNNTNEINRIYLSSEQVKENIKENSKEIAKIKNELDIKQ